MSEPTAATDPSAATPAPPARLGTLEAFPNLKAMIDLDAFAALYQLPAALSRDTVAGAAAAAVKDEIMAALAGDDDKPTWVTFTKMP